MKIIVYVLSLMQGMYSFPTVPARLFHGRTNLQMWIQSPTNFIDRSNVPSCVNCRFFIPATDLYYAKCAKFGTLNLVTGEYDYEPSLICRNNASKCGEKGVHFLTK